MHELHAFFSESRHVFKEPARKHGREHGRRFGVARFTPPDVEALRIDRFDISHCAAVEIVDVGRYRARIFVDADDAADDAVAHDGGNVGRIMAFCAYFADDGAHALDAVFKIVVDIHLHPAGFRIVDLRRKSVGGNQREAFVVDSNLHALRAGVKTHVELAHMRS